MAEDKQAAEATTKAGGLLASVPTWAIAVVAALVLLGLIALVVWWYRKTQAAKGKAPAAPAKPPTLAKSALKDVWSAFLDNAPPGAQDYPVFVVMGDLYAGKSHLIDTFVDWKGVEALGHPSDRAHDEIKLYFGPHLLAQEISSSLLRDTSAEVREALTALWSALGDRTPTVVLVLDASTLPSMRPDELKELAQLARGKLNILSSQHAASGIHVRICLTHVNGVTGFAEIAAALRDAKFSGRLPLSAARGANGLVDSLAPVEDYLSLALTSRPATEFASLVRFFEGMRPALDALTTFVKVVGASDDLSTAPVMDDLSLSGHEPDNHIGYPFRVDAAAVKRDLRAGEDRVKRYCGYAAAIAGALTLGIFSYQAYAIHQAREAVNTFVRASAGTAQLSAGDDLLQAERRAGGWLRDVSRCERLWPPLRVSFDKDKRTIRADFTDALRTRYLLPPLQSQLDRDRLVYAVGLVYAARDNDLGALVLADAPRWVERLGLPDSVPEDYVANSDSAWSTVVAATPAPAAGGVPATDTRAWSGYLTDLDGLFRHDTITIAQLETAKQGAAPLLDVLEQARFYPTIRKIVDILSRDRRLDVEQMFGSLSKPSPAPAWVNDNHDTLLSLLTLVRSSSLPPIKDDGISLQQLLNWLNASAGSTRAAGATPSASASASAAPSASAGAAGSAIAAGPAATREYGFTLDDHAFSFRPSVWSELLLHSRMGMLVEAFIAENQAKGNDHYSFFASDPPPYMAVGRGAPGRGASGIIRGIYTRDAVEGEIKPVLLGFDQQLETTPLSTSHKSALATYVVNESSRYADAYRNELRAYYRSYRYSPASAADLEYDLAEIASPTSWLTTFLTTVATESTLDLKGTAPYLDQLARNLDEFRPVAAIAVKLDKYTAVVGKMLPPPSPPSDKPPVLADLLTPEGKVALDILRNEKDNALAAVEPPLEAAGLPRDMRGPFLGPVIAAYGFGRASIEQVIAQRWKQEILGPCAPVLSRYPFDRAAEQEASISDMEVLFTPIKGRFWDGFNRLVAPICDTAEGRWYLQTAPAGLGSPNLPTNTLRVVNGLARMSARLWDKDGKAQALSIGAQAQPLPTPQPGDAAVTLSQLHTGEISVFGFNQTPAPQPLDLVWWNQGTSSVDIQLITPDNGKKHYQTLPARDSAWSFYRLLDRAANVSKQLEVTWKVAVDDAGRTRDIRFLLGADPWAPFQPPPASP